MIALDYAFTGGANADPADKPGVANMVGALLDEGAGELDARAFQERMEEKAIQLGFTAARDQFRGSLRSLSANLDEAVDLLRLALTAPRFDAEPVERIRDQMLAQSAAAPPPTRTRSRTGAGGRRRFRTIPMAARQRHAGIARRDHGRRSQGLCAQRVRARHADHRHRRRHRAESRRQADRPHRSAACPPRRRSRRCRTSRCRGSASGIVVNLDVPQTVINFGAPGLGAHDPDFFAAYVVNHIYGGGSMTSRLYREVREKRGLAYGIRTSLIWMEHANILSGGTATRADRAGETLAIIDEETQAASPPKARRRRSSTRPRPI